MKLQLSKDTGFRVIDGCPANKWIAPYIYIVTKEAGAELLSAYRGSRPPAPAILHAHGHMTQEELYQGYQQGKPGFYPANRPGTSTHEDFSDGVAYPGPPGRRLDWWQEGFDVNGPAQAAACIHLAMTRYNWRLHQPYSSGVELHHLNFLVKPKPGRELMRIHWLRGPAGLPRR